MTRTHRPTVPPTPTPRVPQQTPSAQTATAACQSIIRQGPPKQRAVPAPIPDLIPAPNQERWDHIQAALAKRGFTLSSQPHDNGLNVTVTHGAEAVGQAEISLNRAVADLYVQPHWRAQGIGRQLLDSVTALGATHLHLLHGNPAAPICHHLGWRAYSASGQMLSMTAPHLPDSGLWDGLVSYGDPWPDHGVTATLACALNEDLEELHLAHQAMTLLNVTFRGRDVAQLQGQHAPFRVQARQHLRTLRSELRDLHRWHATLTQLKPGQISPNLASTLTQLV